MELRVLRYFLTVAREENISKAAQTLYITQPTLSRQLQELEKELGTQLFVRGKRRITLTEDGMLLRRRAEEMAELEDKITGEFRTAGENLSGVVSIGAAETRACEILPEAISSFREKYPLVTFELYSDIATNIKERLQRGVDDFGILVEPGDIEKYDFVRLDYDDRCGILMNANSPLAKKDFVTVDDLQGLPIIANKRDDVQQFYREHLGSGFDSLNIIATFNLINNAALFAEKDMGYVFTIESTVKNFSNERLKFLPFKPEITQSTFIVWKKYQTMSRTVRAFLDELIMLSEHKNK